MNRHCFLNTNAYHRRSHHFPTLVQIVATLVSITKIIIRIRRMKRHAHKAGNTFPSFNFFLSSNNLYRIFIYRQTNKSYKYSLHWGYICGLVQFFVLYLTKLIFCSRPVFIYAPNNDSRFLMFFSFIYFSISFTEKNLKFIAEMHKYRIAKFRPNILFFVGLMSETLVSVGDRIVISRDI